MKIWETNETTLKIFIQNFKVYVRILSTYVLLFIFLPIT